MHICRLNRPEEDILPDFSYLLGSSRLIAHKHNRNKYKRGVINMNNTHKIPVWEKYTLTAEEAAAHFRIDEHKLRNLINENKNADYLL